MRLIDVDNFKKNNPEYLKLDIDYVTEVTVEDVLDYEPTVEAIPIEWIEKQIELYYEDGYNSYGKALNIMLIDWKTEKEAEHGKKEN